jgi:tRNA (guanosine-2'-O-)-methyltransferase
MDASHSGPEEDILTRAGKVLTANRLERIRTVAGSRLRGLTVAFDDLHDPHNVSAALRSCEAFGIQDAHLVGGTREVGLAKGVTRGCERWLSLHWHTTCAGCAKALHRQGFQILLAMPGDTSLSLPEIDFGNNTALVFGNEHEGISSEFQAAADGLYHIPMCGFVESFNVSVAVAVSLSYAARARRNAVGAATDMAPEEVDDLLKRWLRRELAMRPGQGS